MKMESPRIGSRSTFYGREGAVEVQATFNHTTLRSTMSRILRRSSPEEAEDFWDLVLTCIREGFCQSPNHYCSRRFQGSFLFGNGNSQDLRELDVGIQVDRTYIRESVLPIARECKAEILAHPDRFDEIMRARRRQSVLDKRSTELPTGEQIIICYGTQLWPTNDTSYDYDMLRTAIWFFRNMQGMLASSRDNSIGSVALNIRLSVKWFSEYAKRGYHKGNLASIASVYHIVRHLTLLWEAGPNGQCAWPPYPLQEGKW